MILKSSRINTVQMVLELIVLDGGFKVNESLWS